MTPATPLSVVLAPFAALALALYAPMADASQATAAAASTAVADGKAECIGLVLGGGGARGAAHIGVLRELERQRIPVCVIAGTSMGAIVGALYATGRSPDEIETILTDIDWADLFRDDPDRARLPMRRKDAQLNYRLEIEAGWRDGGLMLPSGAVQGQKLGLLLASLFEGSPEDFDALRIPFRAVAADIVTGEGYIPDSGNLADIVRASMAVPAVFAPKAIDDHLLVDGGIINNVPISVARDMGADRIIAVDVGSPLLRRDQLRSAASIAFQMTSVLMKERTDRELATLTGGDVLITPALGEFSSADFPNAKTTIPIGEAAAQQAANALATMARPEADWAAWREGTRFEAAPVRSIAFVSIHGKSTTTDELVRERTRQLVGKPLELATIDPAISSVYAEGTYERIGWRSVKRDGEYGVRITPVDKPWGPIFANIGLQFSDDFKGRDDYQLVGELLFTGLAPKGDEVRALLKLGRVTELSADWFSPLNADRDYYMGVDAAWRAQNLPIILGTQEAAEYRVEQSNVGWRLGLQRSPIWSLETGVVKSYYNAERNIGVSGFGDLSDRATSFFLTGKLDTLDRLSFPSSGSRLVITGQHYVPAWSSAGSGQVLRVRADKAWSSGAHNVLLGGRWASTWGEPPLLASYSTLGGFLNLSGRVERSLVGSHLAYGRAIYYYRIGESTGLISAPPYLGFSLEAGNVWADRDDMAFDDLLVGGSVFMGISSPFGPLLLGYGRSEGANTWTLSFGNLIRTDDQ